MEDQPSSSRSTNGRLQRNIRERERRTKMKDLCSRLASVIHPHPHKASVPELINQATNYVNNLHGRIEKLKLQRESYESILDDSTTSSSPGGPKRPSLNVRSWDSSVMEMNLICGSENKTLLFECFRIFQEEGAEVVTFVSHNVGDSTIYSITAQAIIIRIGMDTSRIHERIKELIH